MANQGELLPHHPVHADVQAQHQQQQHLLDAARALLLLGAAAAVSASTVCNCNPDADEAAWVWVFLGFVTWLLGVCFLLSVPLLAGRFPQADRLAGAAIAIAGAVLRRFLGPWN